MKNLVVLDNLKVKINKNKLINKLCIRTENAQEFIEILNQAKDIAEPKALFAQGDIKSKAEDYVVVEDIKFCSRILAVNLKDVYKISPILLQQA